MNEKGVFNKATQYLIDSLDHPSWFHGFVSTAAREFYGAGYTDSFEKEWLGEIEDFTHCICDHIDLSLGISEEDLQEDKGINSILNSYAKEFYQSVDYKAAAHYLKDRAIAMVKSKDVTVEIEKETDADGTEYKIITRYQYPESYARFTEWANREEELF